MPIEPLKLKPAVKVEPLEKLRIEPVFTPEEYPKPTVSPFSVLDTTQRLRVLQKEWTWRDTLKKTLEYLPGEMKKTVMGNLEPLYPEKDWNEYTFWEKTHATIRELPGAFYYGKGNKPLSWDKTWGEMGLGEKLSVVGREIQSAIPDSISVANRAFTKTLAFGYLDLPEPERILKKDPKTGEYTGIKTGYLPAIATGTVAAFILQLKAIGAVVGKLWHISAGQRFIQAHQVLGPLLANWSTTVTSMVIRGQIAKSDAPRVERAVRDTIYGTVFSGLGLIPSEIQVLKIPTMAGLFYAGAKIQGASEDEARVAAFVGATLAAVSLQKPLFPPKVKPIPLKTISPPVVGWKVTPTGEAERVIFPGKVAYKATMDIPSARVQDVPLLAGKIGKPTTYKPIVTYYTHPKYPNAVFKLTFQPTEIAPPGQIPSGKLTWQGYQVTDNTLLAMGKKLLGIGPDTHNIEMQKIASEAIKGVIVEPTQTPLQKGLTVLSRDGAKQVERSSVEAAKIWRSLETDIINSKSIDDATNLLKKAIPAELQKIEGVKIAIDNFSGTAKMVKTHYETTAKTPTHITPPGITPVSEPTEIGMPPTKAPSIEVTSIPPGEVLPRRPEVRPEVTKMTPKEIADITEKIIPKDVTDFTEESIRTPLTSELVDRGLVPARAEGTAKDIAIETLKAAEAAKAIADKTKTIVDTIQKGLQAVEIPPVPEVVPLETKPIPRLEVRKPEVEPTVAIPKELEPVLIKIRADQSIDKYFAADKLGVYIHEFFDSKTDKSTFSVGMVKDGKNFQPIEKKTIEGLPPIIETKRFISFKEAKAFADKFPLLKSKSIKEIGTNVELFREIESSLAQAIKSTIPIKPVTPTPPTKPIPKITMRETTALKERIRQYARGFREGRKFTKDQVRSIQEDLIKTIEGSGLPLLERAKFIRTLKNIQTPEQLAKAEPEIRKRLEKAEARIEKRDAVSSLRKTIGGLDLKKMRPEFRKEIENVLDDLNVINTSKKKLSSLTKTKQFIKDNPEHIMPDYVFDQLKALEQKELRNLTTDEIRIIEATIGHSVKLNELKNKLIFGKRFRDAIRDIGLAIKNVETKPVKKDVDPNLITSEDVIKKVSLVERTWGVESFGMEDIAEFLDRTKKPYGLDDIVKEVKTGEPTSRQIIGEIMYRQVDKGTIKTLAFRHFVNDFIKKNSKGITFDKKGDAYSRAFVVDNKDVGWQDVKLDDGRIIRMSRGDRISIYLLSLRKKAMEHFLEKGFSFEKTPTRVHKISQDDIDKITNSMSENEKKVATIMYEYFNTISKNAINEISMKLNGFPIAVEDNYFPMTTNEIMRFRDHLKTQLTPETLRNFVHTTLEGMGIFKPVTPYTTPLVIEDAFKVLERHKLQVSSYIGLAEPLRNMKMLIYDSNFRSSVIEKFGEHYWDALRDFVYDMESRVQDSTGIEQLTQDLINKLDLAILGINPWVMAKQPVSYILANIEIDSKYLKEAITRYNKKEVAKEMMKWSTLLRDRLEGNITREIGEVMNVGRIMKTWTGKDVGSKKIMGGIRWSDMQAVGRIWNAVKLEVKDKYPDLKGDDYWKVVAARTEHVVRKTQPTFLLKDRSRIARSKNVAIRILTKYTTIRNKMYRLLATETHRYHMSDHIAKDKAKYIKNIAIITLISSLIISGIDELRKLATKKKPSTVSQLVFKTIGNTIGLSYIIGDIFTSLISKIQMGKFAGWDMSNPVSSFLDNTIDATAEFIRAINQAIKGEPDKWKKTMLRAIDAGLDSVGKFKGIPYKTVRDIVEGAIKWIIPEYDTGDLPTSPDLPKFPTPPKLPAPPKAPKLPSAGKKENLITMISNLLKA